MRILSWNIRHGGRSRTKDIVQAVLAYSPDLALLSEYRESSTHLLGSLREAGFTCHSTNVAEHKNGLLIAAKCPIIVEDTSQLPHGVAHRWAEIHLVGFDVAILAVHIPGGRPIELKQAFWQCILDWSQSHLEENALLVGDLNTGLPEDTQGTPFYSADMMKKLAQSEWIDGWKLKHPDQLEYTWYSNVGNGFRLDHAFITPSLAPLVCRVEYSHEERLQKISDHSILLVDIEPL